MTVLDTFRRDGIVRMISFSPAQMLDISAHFNSCRVYNAHVKSKAQQDRSCPQGAATDRWPAYSHSMDDVVTGPHLFEKALTLFSFARDYFDGEFPRLYSMNAFWTCPSAQVYPDTHSWHRDGDDRRQLVMFTFGVDIPNVEDGAHLYQRGTHRLRDEQLGYHFNSPPESAVEIVTGVPGTTFLVDTFGFHMGVRPVNNPRLLLWARWGVSNPPESYGWDQLRPVPKQLLGDRYPEDAELQEAISLVVQ